MALSTLAVFLPLSAFAAIYIEPEAPASFYIKSNGYVGIGTNTPSQPFSVQGITEWNILSRSTNATASNRNHILLQRANGVAAVTSGFNLGGLAIGGYDGTSYSAGWNGGAEISALASENWTTTARGTSLSFGTTGVGSASISERVRISASGNVGIGTTNPAKRLDVVGDFQVSGNSNTCKLQYYSGGTTSCPAGYYTWSGQALASGYMLCCKVDNPI